MMAFAESHFEHEQHNRPQPHPTTPVSEAMLESRDNIVDLPRQTAISAGKTAVQSGAQEPSASVPAVSEGSEQTPTVTPDISQGTRRMVSTGETNWGSDPNGALVRQYLRDAEKYQLLTKDDEVSLARKIKVSNKATQELQRPWNLLPLERMIYEREAIEGAGARQTFIQSNLRLVVSIAKRFQEYGLPLPDLIQEGNFGLMHAVEKFDGTRGFKFSTYATWWICQAIHRGTANTGRTIRIPVHAREKIKMVLRTQAKLSELNRAAGPAELATETGLDESEIVFLLGHIAVPRSLSEQLDSNTDTVLGDVVADTGVASPENEAVSASTRREVEKMLADLNDQEQAIIRLRFGLRGLEPETLEKIGRRFGVTRERIRQIEGKALAKLRKPANIDAAKELLTD